MNPYPFAPLNHFTVPFSLTDKTPFTIAKNVLQIPGFCFGFPKPPSERPQNFRLRVDVQREINSKIEKTPQFPAAISRRRGNFLESDDLALRFHYTQQTSTTYWSHHRTNRPVMSNRSYAVLKRFARKIRKDSKYDRRSLERSEITLTKIKK
jgi:hypothetical protein